MKLKELVAYFAWSVEHQCDMHWRWLWEAGEIWYKLWMLTPVEQNHLLCVFCRKYLRKEGLK